MDYVLMICLVLAAICGIINGLAQMSSVKQNPNLGCPESNSLFTFLFTDKR